MKTQTKKNTKAAPKANGTTKKTSLKTAEKPDVFKSSLLNNEQRVKIFTHMVQAREFDRAMLRLYRQGKAFGGDPTVSCTIHHARPPKPALVRVTIKGTLAGLGDGTTDYLVGDDEHDRIRQFVLRAGFPTVPRKENLS